MVVFTSTIALLLLAHCVFSVPVIQAPWGTIQGINVDGDDGRKMNGYLGIPYALPPVGDLRFEKPQPHPGPGEGKVFVADKMMPACLQDQPGLIGSERETSEDCLMLDVYMPPSADNSTQTYPVMIFIHGGGFTMGDAPFYRSSKMAVDGKVIIVMIQYRLGVFGFFSTGDGAILGNQGLWDQSLAIRWVKNNIRAFNGDPDVITIFGESAGSMSVGLQMFSPQSRGLFKRAIMQSGSPQSIALFTGAFDMKVVFKDLTDVFECQGNTNKELIQCLKQQPVNDFFNRTREFEKKSPMGGMFFPIVDGEFIPRDLKELAKDEQYTQENGIGDIDLIMGFNNKEGALALMMLEMLQLPPEALNSPDFFGSVMQMCLMFSGQASDNEVLKKSVDFFYRKVDAGTNNSVPLEALVDMYGDCLMNAPITEWMRYLAASPHSVPRYLYVMDHDFNFNNQGLVPGSHHGDEIALQFDNKVFDELPSDSIFGKMNKTKITADEIPLAAKFVDIFTTFARTGNPNPPIRDDLGGDWPEFTLENESYLSISHSPRVVTDMGPYKDRVALWLKLLPQLATVMSPTQGAEGTEQGQQTTKEEL